MFQVSPVEGQITSIKEQEVGDEGQKRLMVSVMIGGLKVAAFGSQALYIKAQFAEGDAVRGSLLFKESGKYLNVEPIFLVKQ